MHAWPLTFGSNSKGQGLSCHFSLLDLRTLVCAFDKLLILVMPGLKLYYDLMSQPSRAVYLFLRMNNIPYTDKLVALRKGNTKLIFTSLRYG